jgi:hypothetical protein
MISSLASEVESLSFFHLSGVQIRCSQRSRPPPLGCFFSRQHPAGPARGLGGRRHEGGGGARGLLQGV